MLVEGEDKIEIETQLQHRPIKKSTGDISYRVKWLGLNKTVGNLKGIINSTHLRHCRSIGMALQYKQLLSLLQALALGWPLVTSKLTV